MEPSTSGWNPSEKIWSDDEEIEPLPNKSYGSARLVDGINIRDLCDGKEVMFEISKDGDADGYFRWEEEEKKDEEEEFEYDDDEADEGFSHSDTTLMREKRIAPCINSSFEEISSKMTNLTEDGFVKKQLIISGIGKKVPARAFVTFHYNMFKEKCDMPFDSSYLRNRPEKLGLDQGRTIPGLEIAIKSMKKSENSMFFIKWEVGFGAMGCPDRIGPKCDIVADVTLLNFVEVDHEIEYSTEAEMDNAYFEKGLNKAKRLLCVGSDGYSKGQTNSAASNYRKALEILQSLKLADEHQEKLMLKEKLKCLVNLAVCYNKMGKYEMSCVACQKALSIEHNNVKANFHYGRANLYLSNFPTAKKYLLRADKLKPYDKDINNEIKKLHDKKALYDLENKQFWCKAFNIEQKEKSVNEEKPSPLKTFKKSLMASLEECLKEGKPYILPMPLLEEETRVCDEVAAYFNIVYQADENFLVFKNLKNPGCQSEK